MELGRIVIAGLAFSVAAAGAAGEVLFIRPGPCAASETYLLAANSGAIIRVETAADAEQSGGPVIFYRKSNLGGWASQHLLRRFDLQIDEHGTTVVNSGSFCRGHQ